MYDSYRNEANTCEQLSLWQLLYTHDFLFISSVEMSNLLYRENSKST